MRRGALEVGLKGVEEVLLNRLRSSKGSVVEEVSILDLSTAREEVVRVATMLRLAPVGEVLSGELWEEQGLNEQMLKVPVVLEVLVLEVLGVSWQAEMEPGVA